MEPEEIELLLQQDFSKISEILSRFLGSTTTTFLFRSLSVDNRRSLVWTALFQHIQNSQATEIHQLCLATIKILSRDKVDLDKLLCEKWINTLIERAGLYHLAAYNEESPSTPDFPQKDINMEALKCLYNLTLNSETARALCSNSCLADGLVCRLRAYRDLPSTNEIMLFDMRLLFLLTAYRDDFKTKIRKLHGTDCLVNCLNEILSEASKNSPNAMRLEIKDDEQVVVCEILKAQFNLMSHPTSPIAAADEDDAVFALMMPLLHTLLLADTTGPAKRFDVRSNVVNFLTCVPVKHYHLLSPPLDADAEPARYVYEGHNMDAVQVLIEFLQNKLDNTTELQTQFEALSVILTVLHKASGACRLQRKFLRSAILPPLTDVSRPPEQGDTTRNRLCRLLTSPVTQVRDLAAELLFILCKEKVSRFVKYTGFGNAAGMLAQRGLLTGGRTGDYSSGSEDSDTDEYRAAQPTLDPVVGCTRPPRINPLEGMSEEQKEYEAMQLVNALDQLHRSGIKPARIGEDGRPQPVQHVLQLREANVHQQK